MRYTPEQKAAWDRVMQILKETGDKIVILGQNAFNLQHMQVRYGTMLVSTVDMVFDRKYTLEFHTEAEVSDLEEKLGNSTLNEKYTFDNFVVGGSNQLAFSAALAVAEAPSETYNPLFIYGGVGLGKTHLMNAVGNYVVQRDPSKKVLLMTSETITNQLIEGIARKNTTELRNRLRGADYLLVDDIQFLAKTKATQEEFFNTFNDLRENHKQIIISSDRPPKEIPEIEERLRSRFEWGLIVDIQKPDFETRMAILQQKAAGDGIDAPYEVLEYIARSVNTNIRTLEGCLTSLNAHSRLMLAPITLELAKSALNPLVKAQEERRITSALIIDFVADKYGVASEDMTGKRRSRDIALPRQVAMYICREMTDLSTTAIGQAFGGRDHTTVMHGCDKISETMEADSSFKKRVEEIMRQIEES